MASFLRWERSWIRRSWPSINKSSCVGGVSHIKRCKPNLLQNIVHPGIDTLPSGFVTGIIVLLKSPLLKLAVVNVDAPPTDTKPAAATEVTSVEPIIVEVRKQLHLLAYRIQIFQMLFRYLKYQSRSCPSQ